MINNVIDRCISQPDFVARRLSRSGLATEDVALLISFPRSGSGWIRSVLSFFFAIEVDRIAEAVDLGSASFYNLKEELSVSTQALLFGNGNLLAVGAYVPDLYQYERVCKALEKTKVPNLLSVSPKRIFKSHHLIAPNAAFRSLGIILRNPDECVVSAALMLEEQLLERSDAEIQEVLEYFVSSYTTFLEVYGELMQKMPTYFIPFDAPEYNLAQWIVAEFPELQLTHARAFDALKLVTRHFPHRSGFDKRILDRVALADIAGYSKMAQIYTDLSLQASPTGFSED